MKEAASVVEAGENPHALELSLCGFAAFSGVLQMVHRFGSLAVLLALAFCLPAVLAEDKKEGAEKPADKTEAKFTAKCPVSGADAKKEQAAKYKEKDVYFCCEKCKAAFEADSAKYATKANHQLVQTKQFRQTQCPLSGGKVNKEQSVKVEGVKVTFCCDKCKGAIEAASKEDQLTKVFAEDVFAKSFTAKKENAEKATK
jgi:YHS domain-containing protein